MTWAFTINLSLHNSQSNKKTLVKMQHGAISLYITDLYGLKYQSSTASSESEMIFISWKSWIFLIEREFSHLMCIHLLLFKKNPKILCMDLLSWQCLATQRKRKQNSDIINRFHFNIWSRQDLENFKCSNSKEILHIK